MRGGRTGAGSRAAYRADRIPRVTIAHLRFDVVLLPRERAKQPRLSHFPVALDRLWRDSQDLRGFLDTQSAEVTQLHHAAFAGIDLGQRLECLVQCQYSDPAGPRPQQHVIQRHAYRIAAALGIPPAARMVHQNSPDDLRTEREKVYAVLTANAARSNQLEVSLIGQGGRFQRVTGGATPQLLPRDSPQLRVDERHQVAQSFFVAVTPGSQQPTDVPWIFLGHAGADPTTK